MSNTLVKIQVIANSLCIQVDTRGGLSVDKYIYTEGYDFCRYLFDDHCCVSVCFRVISNDMVNVIERAAVL